MDMVDFRLYVARDRKNSSRHDLGSILCIRVVDLVRPGAVTILECTPRDPANPSWLVGTPTLHHVPTGEIWRGHQALSRLQHLVAESNERPAAAAKAAAPAPAPAAARPPADEGVAAEAGEPENMWSVTEDDEGGEDDGALPHSRKLTGDDLARAISARQAASSSNGADARPPKPMAPLSD